MPTVSVRLPAKSKTYDILIGAGLLGDLGSAVREQVGQTARSVALISNRTVFDLYGKAATGSLRSAGFTVKPFLVATASVINRFDRSNRSSLSSQRMGSNGTM